ncbi:MAG: bifunctional hydroxymethylpyrimidine kinase/phosphomethylpyrimidine kinase, partial [Planctomycetota bacterium]
MSEATQSPVALTIAGSDPSGGAGLQADLKTFHRWGCYGASVVTLLTVQNTLGVLAVESMPVELVLAQYRAVTDDFTVDAIKTGALGNADLITAISTELATQNASVIVDPVMISKHGDRLIEDDAVAALREQLIPTATLITPNRFEAETLSGIKIDSPKSLLRAANLL